MELTRYELTQAIGVRAEQLARGAPPLVEVDANATVYEIALKEYETKRLPFQIARTMPDGKVIYIKTWS